ncbi:hypothetical protein [Providencia sneebia]|uniref:hypothetical protein n=1 Tax=Providencia sneebia TaxID=516075 RepID=UPI0002E48B9F|nr:hypothetical protein [Providencia sneebia]
MSYFYINNLVANLDDNYHSKEQDDSEQQNILSDISILKKCEYQLNKIDHKLDNMDNLNIEVLNLITNQQKQVVLSMLGVNAEKEISGILAASIEVYTQN